MTSPQQRALQKLYGANSSLTSRSVALAQLRRPTRLAREERTRLIAACEYISTAIAILEDDLEVEGEFQIELPF